MSCGMLVLNQKQYVGEKSNQELTLRQCKKPQKDRVSGCHRRLPKLDRLEVSRSHGLPHMIVEVWLKTRIEMSAGFRRLTELAVSADVSISAVTGELCLADLLAC